MKAPAILLSAFLVAADATPRSVTFAPNRLALERSFPAPGLWLMAPGGRYIATETGGDSFGLLDAAAGRDLGVWGGHEGAARHDGNWGLSGRFLATCGMDGSVRVWDAATKKQVAIFSPHAGYT